MTGKRVVYRKINDIIRAVEIVMKRLEREKLRAPWEKMEDE